MQTHRSRLPVRNQAEDLGHARLALEQGVLLSVSLEERGFCVAEEHTQAFAFAHLPGAVSYRLVCLVFSENNVLDRILKNIFS